MGSLDKVLLKNAKKIHNWSNGYGVYLTKECKFLGWNNKTMVSVSVVRSGEIKRITIEKI